MRPSTSEAGQRSRSWRDAWKEVQPVVRAAAETVRALPERSAARALRVNQLDAERLDSELYDILDEHMQRALTYVSPSTIEKYRPEIDAVFGLAIHALSIQRNTPSPGNFLQNVYYRRASAGYKGGRDANDHVFPFRLRVMHGFFSVVVRYMWSRLRRVINERGWAEYERSSKEYKLWQLFQYIDTAYRLFALFNFVAFLWTGRYRSLLDRLTGYELAHRFPRMPRHLSFEYLHQMLLWEGLSEVFVTLGPLINIRGLITRISQRIRRARPSGGGEALGCPACGAAKARTAYVAECRHVHCYYCIRCALEDASSCSVCSAPIRAIRPARRSDMESD